MGWTSAPVRSPESRWRFLLASTVSPEADDSTLDGGGDGGWVMEGRPVRNPRSRSVVVPRDSLSWNRIKEMLVVTWRIGRLLFPPDFARKQDSSVSSRLQIPLKLLHKQKEKTVLSQGDQVLCRNWKGTY